MSVDIDWDGVGLGERPDAVIARELGCRRYHVRTARRERGIPTSPRTVDWDEVGLGERPDADIAEEHGIDRSGVARVRRERGIKPYELRIDWAAVPLGDFPDAVVAKWLNVSLRTVRSARRQRGVGFVRHRKGDPVRFLVSEQLGATEAARVLEVERETLVRWLEDGTPQCHRARVQGVLDEVRINGYEWPEVPTDITSHIFRDKG